jgi:hypothetical protein
MDKITELELDKDSHKGQQGYHRIPRRALDATCSAIVPSSPDIYDMYNIRRSCQLRAVSGIRVVEQYVRGLKYGSQQHVQLAWEASKTRHASVLERLTTGTF